MRRSSKWVSPRGRTPSLLRGGLCSRKHCRDAIDATVKIFGNIDVLVNNAAIQPMRYHLEDIRPQVVERCFRTNISAMFDLCQAAAPHMKPGSAMTSTTSVNAKTPQPQMLVYATTKGAIATVTVGPSCWAAQGTRVNGVVRGPV